MSYSPALPLGIEQEVLKELQAIIGAANSANASLPFGFHVKLLHCDRPGGPKLDATLVVRR